MSENNSEYLAALGATSKLNSPPLGLVQTSGLGNTNDKIEAILKQNNVLIELITRLSSRVDRLLEEKLIDQDLIKKSARTDRRA